MSATALAIKQFGTDMRIESLAHRRVRRTGDIIEIRFDDGSILELDAELAVRFRLATGAELSGGDIARLEAEQARLAARRRLVRHLAARRKTVREAHAYLERLGFPPDAVTSAVEAALDLGLLDDARFAQSLCRTHERVSHRGPRAIRHELVSRGVAPETADAAVQPSRDPDTQRANARHAAQRRAAALQGEPAARARQKLHAFLLRKGYDPDIADEVTRQIMGESDE
jgi:SOS response regulatory protein OraA/RecX